MGKKFTPKSSRSNRPAAKIKMAGRSLFAYAAIVLIMAFAALHMQAADTNSGNAKQATGNTVWFGSYPQAYYGWPPQNTAPTEPYVLKLNHRVRDGQNPPQMRPCFFLVQPVKWNVLTVDAQGILLVASENIDTHPYNNGGGSTSWSASTLRTFLADSFMHGSTALPSPTDYFSSVERNAVVVSSLLNPTTGPDVDGISTNDSVFLLSAEDAQTLFASDNARKGYNTDYAASYENTFDPHTAPDDWLTRSHIKGGLFPGPRFVTASGLVNQEDGLNDRPYQVRPALRLSRDAVVMLSDAAGKPAYSDGSLKTTDIPSGSSLKLTLADASLALTSSSNKYPIVVPSGTVTLNYAGVSTGPGRYVSCTLEEQGGNMLYYAKLADASSAASGTVSIAIPAAVLEGSYVLKLFCEAPNANPQTPDLASQPVVFNLGVSNDAVAPAITTATLSDGITGLAFDIALTATGTPAPVWELSSGTIPPGLTLEPAGQLHGTPTAAGSYSFTLAAINGVSSDTRPYTVQIQASSPPVITSPAAGALASQVRGVAYTPVTVVATGFPAPTFDIIDGSLPLGITLNTATGEISGTPTKEVNATFTVEASNFAGVSSQAYSINIVPTGTPAAPAFITPLTTPLTPLPTAYADKLYSFQFEVTGVPAPDFSSIPMPAGLTLSNTGLLSGTPFLAVAGQTYTLPIKIENTVTSVTEIFSLEIAFLLNPPTLATLPVITTTDSNPFHVTATFERPVSGLIDTDISVVGGSPSNVAMDNPAGSPVRASIWSFDVTPDPTNSDGTLIKAWILPNAALDEHGAQTVSESDTVVVTYRADRPVGSFSFAEGQVFLSDPNGFSFTVNSYGLTSALFVGAAALDSDNVDGAIEITRDGATVEGWDATVSGNTVTVNGVFGMGAYTVTLKGNTIRNDLGHYLGQTVGHFLVQTSTNWYEDCTQTVELNFAASGSSRQLTVEYRDLAASAVVAADGSSAPTSLTVAAGNTEAAIELKSLYIPALQEGETGEIVIRLGGAPLATLSGLHFYNRPTEDDIVYIPPTTLYSGYFAQLRSGSPYLLRSINGGSTWQNAWTPLTLTELSNIAQDVRFREPDGCYETVIPVSSSANVNYSIRRTVMLPAVQGIVTLPAGGGAYSTFSGEDFVFRLTPGEQYAGMIPDISTGRLNVPDSIGVVVTPNGDGSFEVRVRVVREPVNIGIRMIVDTSIANAGVEARRVWTAGGQLYVSAAHSGEARVYTTTGALVRSLSVEAGQTSRTPLAPGFYIVAFDDGSKFKVSGF
ncbi:MAG: Ig domain-containing protein [Tannerella sp.]|nr:Ig domain-containing protein [Tannerella sp.]